MPSAAACEDDEAENDCCADGHCTLAQADNHNAERGLLEQMKPEAEDEGTSHFLRALQPVMPQTATESSLGGD